MRNKEDLLLNAQHQLLISRGLLTARGILEAE